MRFPPALRIIVRHKVDRNENLYQLKRMKSVPESGPKQLDGSALGQVNDGGVCDMHGADNIPCKSARAEHEFNDTTSTDKEAVRALMILREGPAASESATPSLTRSSSMKRAAPSDSLIEWHELYKMASSFFHCVPVRTLMEQQALYNPGTRFGCLRLALER